MHAFLSMACAGAMPVSLASADRFNSINVQADITLLVMPLSNVLSDVRLLERTDRNGRLHHHR